METRRGQLVEWRCATEPFVPLTGALLHRWVHDVKVTLVTHTSCPSYCQLWSWLTQLANDVAEQLLIRWDHFGFCERQRDPSLVNEIAPRNIVVGAIATPRPATERKRLSHAIPYVAAIGGRLGLIDHYA